MADRIDRSRRRFLLGAAAEPAALVRPPWSSEASVRQACTGCGACVEACPQRIIVLATGLPHLDFSVDECTFCGACAEACPAPVFANDDPPFRHRVGIGAECFVRRGIVCQSCGDACPEAAIRFRPVLGSPPVPEILPSRCSGCGACIAACPADAVEIGFAEDCHA